jgi:hypothetical protein
LSSLFRLGLIRAYFFFNLSGSNSPPLATKKRVLLVHQDTPLLAAGQFISEIFLPIVKLLLSNVVQRV